MGASLLGAAVLGAVVGIGFYTLNVEASGGSPGAKRKLRESSWAVAFLSSAVALFASFMIPEGNRRAAGAGGSGSGEAMSGGGRAASSRGGARRMAASGAAYGDRYHRDEISLMMSHADRGKPPF